MPTLCHRHVLSGVTSEHARAAQRLPQQSACVSNTLHDSALKRSATATVGE